MSFWVGVGNVHMMFHSSWVGKMILSNGGIQENLKSEITQSVDEVRALGVLHNGYRAANLCGARKPVRQVMVIDFGCAMTAFKVTISRTE